MKCDVIYAMVCACCWGLLCIGCTKEDFVFSGNGGGGEVEGENGGEMVPPMVSSDAASFFNFAIFFDGADRENYGNVVEEVEAGNPDFPENHEFVHQVTLTYSAAGVDYSELPQGVFVVSSGANVTVLSSVEDVEFILKGRTETGSFKYTGTTDFKLTLDGVSLVNPVGAVINVQTPVRTFVAASEATQNVLTDGMEYGSSKEEGKACVFSKGNLVFCGSGRLSVNGNYKHAVAADGAVSFRGGCKVEAVSHVKDGVHAGADIYIGGGQVEIMAEGDGLQSEEGMIKQYGGYLQIFTSGQKSHGMKSVAGVIMDGGALHAKVSGAASKCISCDGDVSIFSGKAILLTEGDSYYDPELVDMSSCAGIKCGGNMTMSGGYLAVYSMGAAGKGINCDGRLDLNGTSVVKVITEGTRAVQGGIKSSPKGISAEMGIKVDCDTLWVKAIGGEGSEGMDSKTSIIIERGEIALYCFDDCISTTNQIVVNGGRMYCYSSDNDGMDSKGTVEIHGGQVIAIGAPGTEEGIDYELDGFTVTGGTVIAVGGKSSLPSLETSLQNSVLYSGEASEGQVVYIQDVRGENVLMYQIPRDFKSMHVLLCGGSLVTGEIYSLWTGSRENVHGGTGYFGLYTGSVCTEGRKVSDFTISSVVTQIRTE